jgi:hypothetical protein
MYITRTSIRAFLLALLPLFFIHAVLFAMALITPSAEGAATFSEAIRSPLPPPPPAAALPLPDYVFGMLLLRVGLDALGLLLGHFVARRFLIGSRTAYALIGALAAATGYTIALRFGLSLLPPIEGAMVTAGILPTLAGLAAGFLYGQFAGRELVMSPANAVRADEVAAQNTGDTVKSVPAPLPATFDGPVQVRTSFVATMLAAIVPAFLFSAWFFTFTWSLVSGVDANPGQMRFDWSRQVLAIAMPAQMFLINTIVTIVPGSIFVALAHAAARNLRWTSGLQYAASGALVGACFGIALVPFGGWPSWPFTGVGFLILPLAILGAIMMAVYRRLAGLEPRALPEAVLAREPETLVPEEHPSRRTHSVVLNG